MGERMGHRPMMPSVDDQIKHLTQKLSLTDDQQTKLKPILEDQRKQMEQIHNDSSLSREDRFSKMQQVRASSDTQIKAVLNDDQQKKFDKMREEQRSHMRWGQGPGGQKPEGAPDQQP
jgi:Spy/CpxP family protein refolding chaperone